MSVSFRKTPIKRSTRLAGTEDVLRAGFLALRDTSTLSELLDCSHQQLMYWSRVAPQALKYRTFEIKKRSGAVRSIEAPHPVLKILQRKLLQVLTAAWQDPRPCVNGFVRGRGIGSNARFHTRRAWVLNFDLADFFHSVNFGRVRGAFMARPFGLPGNVATAIAQLSCSHGRLPQGSPVSPIIANIVCSKLDGELRRLSKESGAFYSRYADDITVSVRRRGFPGTIAQIDEPEHGVFSVTLSDSLQAIVESNGFSINSEKTRIQPWKRSQRVTGLVVNRKVNVQRRFVRRVRAMLHAWRKFGLEAASVAHFTDFSSGQRGMRAAPSGREFEAVVRGHIEFIGQVRGKDDPVFNRLLSQFRVLTNAPEETMPQDTEEYRDVFLSHASEDKPTVVEPLVDAFRSAGISVWFDRAEIRWGDSVLAKVNEGLKISRYVMLVLSPTFVAKEWPRKELHVALNREIASGVTSVLPLMVGDKTQIAETLSTFPLLSDKLYVTWSDGVENIVDNLRRLLTTQSGT